MLSNRHASLRTAAEFRVEMKQNQAGQAHRAAAGSLVDYRLQEVTDSAVRAICTVPGNFADKPRFASPWHYHDCHVQIAVILEGSVELGYQADTYCRAARGDILFIPGQTMHDVSATSADYQIAEITFPGTFGTVEAPMPAPGTPTAAVTLNPSHAPRAGVADGMVEYVYPIAKPYSETYAIHRFSRSRIEPFSPHAHAHDDAYRMTIIVQGSRVIDLGDGKGAQTFARGDLLVLPGGADFRDLGISDDYDAIEVRLLHA